MPCVDPVPLARMVYFLCRRLGDRDSATALVHNAQRRRCRKLFRVGVGMGPRPGEPDLFLAEKYRILYPADPRGRSLQIRRLPRSPTSAAFLLAIYALLHRS